MSFEQVLSLGADGLTLLAGITALLIFFVGARLREAIASIHRWQACRNVSQETARRLRSKALRAPFQRMGAREVPSVAHLLTLLSDQRTTDGAVDDISWNSAANLTEAGRGLQEFSLRMSDSVLARVGSAARADAHAESARCAGIVLEDDAGYAPILAPSPQIRPLSGCAKLLCDFDAELLAGPLWAGAPPTFATGDRGSFDGVRVSERRGLPAYGIDGPIASIAAGKATDAWNGLIPGHTAQQLTKRAADLALVDIENGNDAYNGYFPRLLGWRVESAARHAGRRLHLLAGETTFFTWRVLNEQMTRIRVQDDRLFDHHDGNSSTSVGSAHLPVAVSLVTADGYLILRRRSVLARFSPGRIESAANGNPEIRQSPGVACDRNSDGLIDMAGAARRELIEELGPVPLGSDPRALGMIAMSGDEEERAVYLMFEARTDLNFSALRERFQMADPTEGFHESSGQLVALPIAAEHIGQSFDFILTETDVRPFTRVMTVVALAATLEDPGTTELPRCDSREEILYINR